MLNSSLGFENCAPGIMKKKIQVYVKQVKVTFVNLVEWGCGILVSHFWKLLFERRRNWRRSLWVAANCTVLSVFYATCSHVDTQLQPCTCCSCHSRLLPPVNLLKWAEFLLGDSQASRTQEGWYLSPRLAYRFMIFKSCWFTPCIVFPILGHKAPSYLCCLL